MPRKRPTLDFPRRTPKQERSRDTVDVIFEATARILVKEGRAALTTNHIAERAGISVGTLYQYFPNKGSILLGMARKEIAKAVAAVEKAIGQQSEDPIAGVIRALIGVFGNRRKARSIVFRALIAEGFGDELERNMDTVAAAVAAHGEQLWGGGQPLTPVTAFILTRAVNGVLVSASREESTHIDTPEFEAELVRLVKVFIPRNEKKAGTRTPRPFRRSPEI